MASYIPRLEWNERTINGDSTNASAVISGISDTTNIKVGMVIDAAAFPADTTVLSKTVNSVTLSANATSTLADHDFDFFERFTFPYPSLDNVRPEYLPTEQISESVGGVRQTQINNIIKKVTFNFTFIPKASLDSLETNFYLAWAVFGYSFRYYQSYEIDISEDYELDNYDWKPVNAIPSQGDFLMKLALKFRRVYL